MLLVPFRIAAQAERLHWRRLASRYVRSAAFGLGAAIFALMALIVLHIAAWNALAWSFGAAGAALALAAADLLLCLSLGWFALRSSADPILRGAQDVRDTALLEVEQEARSLGGLLRRPTPSLLTSRGIPAIGEGQPSPTRSPQWNR